MKTVLPVIISLFLLFLPFQSLAQESTPSPQTRFQERREALQEKRESIEQKAKERRAALKAKQETQRQQLQQKREKFRERVKTLRDQKKKAIVERIDSRMASINAKQTNRMRTTLDKLEGILDKIAEKASLVKQNGKDTTALEQAITDAQTAISGAKTRVEEQAGKEYIIEIVDENTLRQTVGKVMSQLQQDLRNVHKAVVGTKQAVMKASQELAKLRGE